MKERIELPISANYVGHWTVYEALREIYQNAIDQESISKESMISDYNGKTNTLIIGSKNTTLEKKTLVLGNSGKAEDKTQIGSFGEGYKLALVVLLRNNLKVTIKNNTEIWVPSIEYSDKFETDILVITIEENTEAFDKELLFVIDNIFPKIYNAYTQYNLKLQGEVKYETVSQGQILLDTRNQAKVFIAGLFVCEITSKNYKYGYNFNPNSIPVDRDRMKIDGFDLQFLTNQMVKELAQDDKNITKVKELIKMGASEASYYSRVDNHRDRYISETIASDLYKEFKEEHPNTIPVPNQEELRALEEDFEGVKGFIVSDTLFDLYSSTADYEEEWEGLKERDKTNSPYEDLIDFMNVYGDLFTPALKIKYGNELLEKSKKWENK